LYWGPVPALLLTAVSPFYPLRVGDLQLVLVFVCGIFLMQSFLAISIWDRIFSNLPRWVLLVSILVIGLSSPVTFMLTNQIGARIYEAAATGAQFFLVGGFVVAFSALNGTLRAWKLMLAGALWALAVGTRQTVLPAVCIMALTLLLATLKRETSTFQKVKNVAILAVPLVMGLTCLGWYNWARFGSITESGLYYQLNYGFVHYYPAELFGLKYVFQNLYNYLVMPFQIESDFPFLYPVLGNQGGIFSSEPSIYHAQLITGLLCTAPFVVFAVIPLPEVLRSRSVPGDGPGLLNWVVRTLGGGSLVSFGVLLLFFWAAMRYAFDFMPSLILLSVIGFWWGYSLLSSRPIVRRIYVVLGVCLAGLSILVSSLLAISVNDARFELIRLLSLK
jgi:hypothetical protein